MDPLVTAAEMIAEDAIRMAKNQGVTKPEDVEIPVIDDRSDITAEMLRGYIREKWDSPSDPA